jgi:hypothetical protein
MVLLAVLLQVLWLLESMQTPLHPTQVAFVHYWYPRNWRNDAWVLGEELGAGERIVHCEKRTAIVGREFETMGGDVGSECLWSHSTFTSRSITDEQLVCMIKM